MEFSVNGIFCKWKTKAWNLHYLDEFEWDGLISINTGKELEPYIKTPSIKNTNFYRKMEMRLRKAFEKTDVERTGVRHGHPIEYGITGRGMRAFEFS